MTLDAIRQSGVGASQPGAARPATPSAASGGPAFADALGQAQSDLRLSRHAQKRVDRRELNLDSAQLQRLDEAVGRAAGKGSRNSVVMLDDLAVVVDVQGRTVVTAMQQNAPGSGGRVFTNIDSVVIA